MIIEGPALLLALIAGHAIGDYPLQGGYIAESKNRNTPIGKSLLIHSLTAHSLIHGGIVALLTGSAILGLAETVIHWFTDFIKCEDKINLHVDQLIHVGCKVVWFLLLIYGVV